MSNQQIIARTVDFVEDRLQHSEAGHDWWHVDRVRRLALKIAERERGDLFVIELGALLPEGLIVQDADRLDAMGAIGIARAFTYGAHIGRELYNPDIKPVIHQTFEEYKDSKGPTINHFYEKLLLLKDKLNTKTAQEIAIHRHQYMEQFLDEFLKEWEGEV